MELLVNFQVKQ